MKLRMTMATGVAGLALTLLTGCSSDPAEITSDPTSATPTPETSLSPAPSVDPDTKGSVALRGDWEIPSEDYVLHLIEDGTFVQDYQGIEDFRTGKYSVEGDTISLVGDDGDTDEGKIVDDTLVFQLGTATRRR